MLNLIKNIVFHSSNLDKTCNSESLLPPSINREKPSDSVIHFGLYHLKNLNVTHTFLSDMSKHLYKIAI